MSELTDRMRYIAKHANKHHLEYPDTFNPRTVLAMLDVIDAAEREGERCAWYRTRGERCAEGVCPDCDRERALDRFRAVAG